MFERPIAHRYDDPVDLIWIRAAEDLGLKIHRSADAFASYDGKGTLTIAEASDFDADDCLAQMIFHEICHWLVAGRLGNKLVDWGLNNTDDSDLVLEYAAHRVQAALSAPYGLRDFMAVTTDWRPYWDSLPLDPLRDGDDPAIAIAQAAAHLARLQPFESVLQRSLSATAVIADAIRGVAQPTSLWSLSRARHRLGSLYSDSNDLRCGSCAWAVVEMPDDNSAKPFVFQQPDSSDESETSTSLDASIQSDATGKSDAAASSNTSATSGESGTPNVSDERRLGCRQHTEHGKDAPIVNPKEQACERWEPKFSGDDCGTCGACCRQGFNVLTVSSGDPFRKLHPALVQLRDDGEYCVPRPAGVCVALDGDGSEADSYRCRHYDTRPENCADFEVAGDACLQARRRVGLSR